MLLPNQVSIVISRPGPGSTARSSRLLLPDGPQAAFQNAPRVLIWVQRRCRGTAPAERQGGRNSTCQPLQTRDLTASHPLDHLSGRSW